MIAKALRACLATSSGSVPSASKPTVPETKHQGSSTTARLKPIVLSNGEPKEIRRRGIAVVIEDRLWSG